MKIHGIVLSAVLLLPAQAVVADDYNTIDTVRYVLECMADLGAQNEQNLYTCTCRHDVIARELPFAVYEEATFFERYSRMPGKRGGLVRDNKRAEKLTAELHAAKEKANKECLVVTHISPPQKSRDESEEN